MAPKTNKRAASQRLAAARAAKKPRRSPEEEMLHHVIEVIRKEAEHLPERCCDMLIATAPGSLGAAQDTRHKSQERVVGMIGSVLAEIQAAKEAALAEEQGKLQAVEAKKSELEGVCEQRDQELAATAAAATAASEAHEASLAALEEANQALQAVLDAQAEAQTAQEEAESQSQGFDKATQEHQQILEEGAKDVITAVSPFITLLPLDDSLKMAWPAASEKGPADRGSFDCLVLQQVQAMFVEKGAALRESLAAMAPAAQERASAKAAAESAAAAAGGQVQALEEALAAARGAEAEADAARRAAVQEVKHLLPELRKATKSSNIAQANLEVFTTGPLLCFETLKSRQTESKEEDEPVAMEQDQDLGVVPPAGGGA